MLITNSTREAAKAAVKKFQHAHWGEVKTSIDALEYMIYCTKEMCHSMNGLRTLWQRLLMTMIVVHLGGRI